MKTHLLALLAIAFFSLCLHAFVYPSVVDTDSFYHLRHAFLYGTQGIWDSAFPAAQFSVLATHPADLWYGFHVLLIPVASVQPLVHGLYAGAFLCTLAALLLAYAAFHRLQLHYPLVWTLLMTMMTADLTYRLASLRPHPVTMGLTLLLFSWVAELRTSPRALLPVVLMAALMAWLHLSLSWLSALVVLAVWVTTRTRAVLPSLVAIAAGSLLGLLLRPHPLDALYLAYVQVVELLLLKHRSIPILLGVELFPFTWANALDQLVPVTVLCALALIFARRNEPTTLSATLLAAVFFLLSFTVARRANELFVAFAMILLGRAAMTFRPETGSRRLAAVVAALALVSAPVNAISRMRSYVGFNPFLLRGVGTYLAEHAPAGATVFHAHWDRFGELVFWAPQQRFINGMDPVFQYAFDEKLFWENHFMARDAASQGYTCPAIRCTSSGVKSVADAIASDFHASYALIERYRTPRLHADLAASPHFQAVFEDEAVALYQVQ